MIKVIHKYNLILGSNFSLNACKNVCIWQRKCHKNASDEHAKDKKNKPTELPEEPTTCCMSGCPNCVWLEYAEKLSAYFHDGGERALKVINEKVQDANVRAFLLHELRMRNKP